MNAIEIILTVCSILHGASCTERHLTFIDEGQLSTPYGCYVVGTRHVAKWGAEHPNWTIKRWRCRQAGTFAKA